MSRAAKARKGNKVPGTQGLCFLYLMCKKYLCVLPTAYKTLHGKILERERERNYRLFLSVHCVSLQMAKSNWHMT